MNSQNCCFNVVEEVLKACWVLTNSCNLECAYCAAKSSCTPTGASRRGETVCRTVVDGCKRAGIRRIILSGGEPLLLPDIVDIVSYLTGNGLGVSICTNGTLLTTELLDDLRMAGVLKLVVGVDVSKVGICTGSSDTDYAVQIFHTLDIIERRSIPYEVNVVFLPMSEGEINRLAKWLSSFRPASVNLIEPQTCGRLAMCDRDVNWNWGERQLEAAAATLIELIRPVKSILVRPKCKDYDCPSERLVFGITAKGRLDKCPWKQHLKVAVPKKTAVPRSHVAIHGG